eukprot:m.57117 g.57117  ORF g.57117 m.57117 type:complete len:1180 (+) comp22337_c0_seq4:236-3775(+)
MAAAQLGRLVKRASWSPCLNGTLNTGIFQLHTSNSVSTWQPRQTATSSSNSRGEHVAAVGAVKTPHATTTATASTVNRKRTKRTGTQSTDPATNIMIQGEQTVKNPKSKRLHRTMPLVTTMKIRNVENIEKLRGKRTDAQWKSFILGCDIRMCSPLHFLVGNSWVPPLYKQYIEVLRKIGLEDEQVQRILSQPNTSQITPLTAVLQRGDVKSLEEYTNVVSEANLSPEQLRKLVTKGDDRGILPLHSILNRRYQTTDNVRDRLDLYFEMAKFPADTTAALIVEPAITNKSDSLNTAFLDVISATTDDGAGRLEMFEHFVDGVLEDSSYDPDTTWHRMFSFVHENGYTPLHIGLKNTCEEKMEWLLQKLTKVEIPQELIDNMLRTAPIINPPLLQASCWSTQPQALQVVLNWIDNSSLTAQEKTHLVQHKDVNGQTAFDSAIDSANQGLLGMFLASNLCNDLPVQDLHKMFASTSKSGWNAFHRLFLLNIGFIEVYVELLANAGLSKDVIHDMLLQTTESGLNIFHCVNSSHTKLEQSSQEELQDCVAKLFDEDLLCRDDLEALVTGITTHGVTVLHGPAYRSGEAVLSYYLDLLQKLAPKQKVAEVLLQQDTIGTAVDHLAKAVARARPRNEEGDNQFFPASRVRMLSSLLEVADDCLETDVDINSTVNSILKHPQCVHKMFISSSPTAIEATMSLFIKASPDNYRAVKRVLLSNKGTALNTVLRAGCEGSFEALISGARQYLNPRDFENLMAKELTPENLEQHMGLLFSKESNAAVASFLKYCLDENRITTDSIVDILRKPHPNASSRLAKFAIHQNVSDASLSRVLNTLVRLGLKPEHFHELLIDEKSTSPSTILSMISRGHARSLELTLEQLQCHLSPQAYRDLLVTPCVLPWIVSDTPVFMLPLAMAFRHSGGSDVLEVFMSALQTSGMTRDELVQTLIKANPEGGILFHEILRTNIDSDYSALKNYMSMLDEKGITSEEWTELLMARDHKGLTAWHLSLIHLDTKHIDMIMQHAKSILSEKTYRYWILNTGGKRWYKPILHVASRSVRFEPQEAEDRITLALDAIATVAGSNDEFFSQICNGPRGHLSPLAILRITGCQPALVYSMLRQVKEILPSAYADLVHYDKPHLHPREDVSSLYTTNYILDLKDNLKFHRHRRFPSRDRDEKFSLERPR